MFAGGAFVLLALAASAAVRRLRGDDRVRAALGAAALALFVNGLVHGALFTDPVSSSLAFGVFGMLLGPVRADRPTLARRFAPWFLLFCAAVAGGFAFDVLVQSRLAAPIERGDELTTEDVGRTLDGALEDVPYAPLALSLRARWLEARAADPHEVEAAWRAVLAVRPFRVEALMQLGLASLRAGDADAARGTWDLARRFDPGHPGLAWNRMTLAFDEERVDDANALADELERAGRLDHDRLLSLATRLELEAKEASAQALWTRLAPEIANATPDQAFALAKARRAENDERLARARSRCARNAATRASTRCTARGTTPCAATAGWVRASGADPAPARMRVELAAALVKAGKAGKGPDAAPDRRALRARVRAPPAWVGGTLPRRRTGRPADAVRSIRYKDGAWSPPTPSARTCGEPSRAATDSTRRTSCCSASRRCGAACSRPPRSASTTARRGRRARSAARSRSRACSSASRRSPSRSRRRSSSRAMAQHGRSSRRSSSRSRGASGSTRSTSCTRSRCSRSARGGSASGDPRSPRPCSRALRSRGAVDGARDTSRTSRTSPRGSPTVGEQRHGAPRRREERERRGARARTERRREQRERRREHRERAETRRKTAAHAHRAEHTRAEHSSSPRA